MSQPKPEKSSDVWIVNEDGLEHLTPQQRLFVIACEYILSDQWGKGTPDPVYAELARMRKNKKGNRK